MDEKQTKLIIGWLIALTIFGLVMSFCMETHHGDSQTYQHDINN